MHNSSRAAVATRLIIGCSLLALASPIAKVRAQDDDLDKMMENDPDRPKAEEGEGGAEGEGEAPKAEGEQPAQGGGDEERPPGEPEDESKSDKSEAEAAPVDDGTKGFELGGLVGYGISFEDGPNIWAFGLGLQAGYDLGMIVIGGRFVYYFGGSAEVQTLDAFLQASTVTVDANVWELGVEAAVDLALSPTVALRPGLGLGFANGKSGSQSKLYGAISPGVALNVAATDSFYVRLDARFQVVTSDPEASKGLILLGGFGLRF